MRGQKHLVARTIDSLTTMKIEKPDRGGEELFSSDSEVGNITSESDSEKITDD